ncbi:hypothetical protein QUF76_02905 [Desulfobacterales bacterium HSG16]|nr:hypothetical protein [Desulfobacterales bacterium HSG16]
MCGITGYISNKYHTSCKDKLNAAIDELSHRGPDDAGNSFKSASDTEVVLKSFQQWDTGCLSRFIGMFAIAVWDRHEKRLVLARNRMGIKPLYYNVNNGCKKIRR